MQFDRLVGRTRIVNAGSVGMPFGEPAAYWLLLGPGVDEQVRHQRESDNVTSHRACVRDPDNHSVIRFLDDVCAVSFATGPLKVLGQPATVRDHSGLQQPPTRSVLIATAGRRVCVAAANDHDHAFSRLGSVTT